MPELGKKYECAECGAKFYDLGKAEPTCPRCGTTARDTATEKTTRAAEPRARYVAPPPPPAAEVEEDLAPDDVVEDDEEILTVEGAEEEEEEEDDDDEA